MTGKLRVLWIISCLVTPEFIVNIYDGVMPYWLFIVPVLTGIMGTATVARYFYTKNEKKLQFDLSLLENAYSDSQEKLGVALNRATVAEQEFKNERERCHALLRDYGNLQVEARQTQDELAFYKSLLDKINSD